MFRIASGTWGSEITALERAHGASIGSFAAFVRALEARRTFFKSLGAAATDHAMLEPYTERLTLNEAERLLQRARYREATDADQRRFEAHMLMEMARMSIEDGLKVIVSGGVVQPDMTRVNARTARAVTPAGSNPVQG